MGLGFESLTVHHLDLKDRLISIFFMYIYIISSHNNNGDKMENKTIWELPKEEPLKLNENKKVDIAIIGGGMAGLNTAYHLKDSDLNIIILERDNVGHGVSKKTTGKLTYLQGEIYPNIEKIRSKEEAEMYFYSQKDAIRLAKEIILQNNIDCDLLALDSYLFANNDTKEYDKAKGFLNNVNERYTEHKELPIDFPCQAALSVSNTYTFHPIKYLYALKKIIQNHNIPIYENTIVHAIDKKDDHYIIHTGDYDIEANKVIVTTHYPFFVLPALLPMSLKLEKTYLLNSQKNNEPEFTAISTDAPYYTFRSDKEHFIFGGFSHNLAQKLNYKENNDEMIETFKNHFTNEIECFWSTHDMTSKDHLPIIGVLNDDNPNLYIATAFHKWGMTNGILSGKIIADIILEKENKYIELFKPDRFPTIQAVTKAIGDNFTIDMTYINTKINKEKDFYKNITFDERDGLPCATYTDENGIEHTIVNRCPHLKCSLIFNELDKTWDCPCHGSRFTLDGELLQGPSVYDVKYEKKSD